MTPVPALPPGTCGFRFSLIDAIAILLCAGVTVALWPVAGAFALVLPVTPAHFFLFCNVFRIHRKLELIWTGVFLANVITWTAFDRFDWATVLAVQAPITVVVIAAEILSSRYHGVFSRR